MKSGTISKATSEVRGRSLACILNPWMAALLVLVASTVLAWLWSGGDRVEFAIAAYPAELGIPICVAGVLTAAYCCDRKNIYRYLLIVPLGVVWLTLATLYGYDHALRLQGYYRLSSSSMEFTCVAVAAVIGATLLLNRRFSIILTILAAIASCFLLYQISEIQTALVFIQDNLPT